MAVIKKNQEVSSDNSWRARLKLRQDLRGDIIKDVENVMSDTFPLGYNRVNSKFSSIGRILSNRHNSTMTKVIEDRDIPNPPTKNTRNTELNRANNNPVRLTRSGSINTVWEDDNINPEKQFNLRPFKVDPVSKDNPEKPFKSATPSQEGFKNTISILNTSISPYIKIDIQGMPKTLEINPESSWATLKSPGKNTADYNYIGSEDTVTMDISWYSVDNNREDVINKCRLLESWSKSNSYTSSPPLLSLIWGDSGIFDGHYYILWSARYSLSNFQRAVRKSGEVVNLKLLPNTATQTLVFKRVSEDNLTHEDVVPISSLQGTYGITT